MAEFNNKDFRIKYKNGVLTISHKNLNEKFVCEAEFVGYPTPIEFLMTEGKPIPMCDLSGILRLGFRPTKVIGWQPKKKK